MRLQKYAETSFYVIIALLPFHGLMAVWLTSLYGHGLLVRSWKEMLLVPTVLWLIWRLFKNDGQVKKGLGVPVSKAIFFYIGLALVYWAAYSLKAGKLETANAVGLVANTRFFVFFLSSYLVFLGTENTKVSQRIMKLVVLIPASVVAAIALLQVTLLPKDFLKHFGFVRPKYQPVLYIDQDNIFLRARSTLRGPNELGAYLITPLLFVSKWYKKSGRYLALMLIMLLAIALSYSRSAFVGLIVSAGLLYGKEIITIFKRYTASVVGKLVIFIAIVILAAIGFAITKTSTFSTLFFHNNPNNSTVGSTAERLGNVDNLIKDSIQHPLGSGLGSSGPASVYGTPNIPDNYYIQLVQELGFLGLILFLYISYLLWKSLRYSKHIEGKVLAACFVGLMITNLFLHNWADDTISMYFFGLSGWYLAINSKNSTKSEN